MNMYGVIIKLVKFHIPLTVLRRHIQFKINNCLELFLINNVKILQFLS